MNTEEKIQWHPAFQQAIKAELKDYAHILTFIEEYQLTIEPLAMDTLIIKKPPEVSIAKDIGRIFKGHNIIEYKSPEESLVDAAYKKAFAYVYLYASQKHVDLRDITLTLITSRHPQKLLAFLRNDPDLTVQSQAEGIDYVLGERIAVQIIETKKLSEEENLWLHSLRGGLPGATLRRLEEKSREFGSEISAYMYAVLLANVETLEGDVEMSSLAKRLTENPEFLREIAKYGYGNVEREKSETAKRLLGMGLSISDVALGTGLSTTRVMEIKAEMDKEEEPKP